MGFREKWLNSKMPRLIAHFPPPLDKDIVGRYTGKKSDYYDEATDICTVTTSGDKAALSSVGWALLSISIIFLLLSTTHPVVYILIIIAVTCIGVAYLAPTRYRTFDRENGLVIFPDWMFRPTHTVPAEELEAFWQGAGGMSGAIRRELITFPPNASGLTRVLRLWAHPGDINEEWSFILWYMDRNRPLPPGDAFDAYRQRDFERRKAEGFPPPMFPSTFPTPEWTDEQNRERRLYWRDEDHYGRSESAWY